MGHRILIALDGSEESEQVLPDAITLARALKAEVILLQIVPPSPIFPAQAAPVTQAYSMAHPEHVEQEAHEAERYLERIRGRVGAGLAVEAVVASGPVAELIVNEARERGVALVAMATHGRSGLARTLMGSVADAVVRTASCPVLLIRAGMSGSVLASIGSEYDTRSQPREHSRAAYPRSVGAVEPALLGDPSA